MKKSVAVGAMVISSALYAQPTGTELEPGAWSETFRIQPVTMDGQDVRTIPPEEQTETVCYSAEELRDLRSIMLGGAEEVCAVEDFAMGDGAFRMTVTCDFGLGSDLRGEFQGHYTHDTYSVEGAMLSEDGITTEVQASTIAHRVGSCEA